MKTYTSRSWKFCVLFICTLLVVVYTGIVNWMTENDTLLTKITYYPVLFVPMIGILFCFLFGTRKRLTSVKIDREQAVSYYFGHKICRVDLTKPVYYYEEPGTRYTFQKTIYISNAPFTFAAEYQVFTESYDLSTEYDWKNVIAIGYSPRVLQYLPMIKWNSMLRFYSECSISPLKNYQDRSVYSLEAMYGHTGWLIACSTAAVIGALYLWVHSHFALAGGIFGLVLLLDIWYSRKRKKNMRYYLRTFVTQREIVSQDYKTRICAVDCFAPIYYAIVHSGEVSKTPQDYILVSNSPFSVPDAAHPIGTYDFTKQVLIPYDERTKDRLDVAQWIAVGEGMSLPGCGSPDGNEEKEQFRKEYRFEQVWKRVRLQRIFSAVLLAGVLLLGINGRYSGMLYPLAVLIVANVGEAIRRKKQLNHYLQTVVTQDVVMSLYRKKPLCIVTRTAPVYYAVVRSDEVTGEMQDYILVSNSPFSVPDTGCPIGSYDSKKQVLIPDDEWTKNRLNPEGWIAV